MKPTLPEPFRAGEVSEFAKVYDPYDVQRLIDEAYAAGQADAREWFPIETCPKNELVVFGPTRRMSICVGMYDTRDGWVTETPSEWASMYTPTHWQPLPPPPSTQQEKDK